MKVILSRKGFDSSYGKIPSPILRTGSGEKIPISLPIPYDEARSDIAFTDLHLYNNHSVGEFVGKIKTDFFKKFSSYCHLDPDISALPFVERNKGWRPAFGQIDIAQSALQNRGVTEGDIFLFFGLFQYYDYKNGHFYKVKNQEFPNGFHYLFGYLKIGKVYALKNGLPTHLSHHPHVKFHEKFVDKYRNNNTLYEATDYYDEQGLIPGAGVFKFDERLILTKRNQPFRSVWHLPAYFDPSSGARLTYHQDLERWKIGGNMTTLSSVAKGQEFICIDDPQNHVSEWADTLIRTHN